MDAKKEIFNLATDIANCLPARLETKRKHRATILRLVSIAIQESERDPNLLEEIKLMIDISD